MNFSFIIFGEKVANKFLHGPLLFQSSVRALKDVSNSVQPSKSKRHRLFPSASSQVLDDTTDNSQPAPIGNIENVHLTARKNCGKTIATKSLTQTGSEVERVPTKRKTRSRATQKSAVSVRRSDQEFQQPQSSKSQSSLEPRQRKVVGYIAMTQASLCTLLLNHIYHH